MTILKLVHVTMEIRMNGASEWVFNLWGSLCMLVRPSRTNMVGSYMYGAFFSCGPISSSTLITITWYTKIEDQPSGAVSETKFWRTNFLSLLSSSWRRRNHVCHVLLRRGWELRIE